MKSPIRLNLWRSATGVVLLLLLIAASAAPTSAQTTLNTYAPFPNPDAGYVTDLAGVLDAEQEEQIERWLWQTEAKTGVEMCVVTIGSITEYPGTPNQSIEAFATGLFNRWGIGSKTGNNGVLLLVAIKDRKARIELGAGYGRARDANASAIMNGVIVPKFRAGDYSGGIEAGVKALMLEFAGVRAGLNWPLISLIVAVPLLGLVAFSLFKNGKRGWGWVVVGLIAVVIAAIIFLISRALRTMPSGNSSSWSPGGFGGGFGGGFSGGGGATGSW